MGTGYFDIEQLRQIDSTFSKEDPVRDRYEMIREFRANGRREPERIARKHGYGITQLYKHDRRFAEEGILGLADRKPGPKGPRKVTTEIEQRVIELRTKEDLSITEIPPVLLEEEEIEISPETVNRILDKHGLPKKKRGRKPKTPP
jgi:transposase